MLHLGSILEPFWGTFFGSNFGPQQTHKKKPVLAREREARFNLSILEWHCTDIFKRKSSNSCTSQQHRFDTHLLSRLLSSHLLLSQLLCSRLSVGSSAPLLLLSIFYSTHRCSILSPTLHSVRDHFWGHFSNTEKTKRGLKCSK